MRSARDISDLMEGDNVIGLELRELHGLPNTLDKVSFANLRLSFDCEAIHVDDWQLKSTLYCPNIFISHLESTYEAVKEFNSDHGEVHEHMIESQKFTWNFLFNLALVILVD